MAKQILVNNAIDEAISRRHPELVIDLRKLCVDNCGFDKSITFSIDGPNAEQYVRRSIKQAKLNFSPHNHKTRIIERVQLWRG